MSGVASENEGRSPSPTAKKKMRLLQTSDNEFINLDAVVSLEHDNESNLTLWFADGRVKRYWGDYATAIIDILKRNSTDLRDLVALNRRVAAARNQPMEVYA